MRGAAVGIQSRSFVGVNPGHPQHDLTREQFNDEQSRHCQRMQSTSSWHLTLVTYFGLEDDAFFRHGKICVVSKSYLPTDFSISDK